MFGKRRGVCAQIDNFGHVCGLAAGHGGEHRCDNEGMRWVWDKPGFTYGSKVQPRITANRVIFGVLSLGLLADLLFIGCIIHHDQTRIRYEDMPPVPVNTTSESPDK